ncbi:ABC transporter ATP-binding protein [Agaribacterium sp. ZY112]|uniref:ABC transporter ATP-binding protein n=1 Tax=Agaribacterium sp. ZY112 TaxID=3233574 RepID=UPI0035255CC0
MNSTNNVTGCATGHAIETGASEPVAVIKGLNKTFAGKVALNDINFTIRPGQVLAILGANGAGKTTLINGLLGRLSLDSGRIRIFGEKPGSLVVKRQTGALLQVASLPDTLKVKEHIQLFQSYYPKPMPYDEVIAYAGLEGLQERYSKKLSGGEKQRLLFALSICGNPKLLFLDEPSVAMDVSARQSLWSAIRKLKQQGAAIVLTSHYLEEADSLADEVLLLKEGKIIQHGTAEEIKASVSSSLIRFLNPDEDIDFYGFVDVVSVAQRGKYISLQSRNTNKTLLSLLAAQPELKELTVSQAGLEQAVLRMENTACQSNGINGQALNEQRPAKQELSKRSAA